MKISVAKILAISTFCIAVFGCKKNDNKGKFALKLVEVSGTVFKNRDQVTFKFETNHAQSEIVNDSLFMRKKFFTCPKSFDLSKIAIPEYTSTADLPANYELTFKYGDNIDYAAACESGNRTDSLIYTFWLKDKNGNLTDSIDSPKIIIQK